jgi:hypothetical protein
VADKITHPHAALSQADCMRMVKQLQDQLDEVCSSMCSDLIAGYSVNVMCCDLMWCAVACGLAAEAVEAVVAVDVIPINSTKLKFASSVVDSAVCNAAQCWLHWLCEHLLDPQHVTGAVWCSDTLLFICCNACFLRVSPTRPTRQHCLQVCDELMNIELRQVEKFEALVDEFENRLNELKTEALEGQQLFFRSIEDLEEKFSSGMCVCCVALVTDVERKTGTTCTGYCLLHVVLSLCTQRHCAADCGVWALRPILHPFPASRCLTDLLLVLSIVGVRSVAQDLIDRLAREELAEDYLDDEAMSMVIDKVGAAV